MDALARRTFLEGFLGTKTRTTKTNLYHLIEAIQEEVSPGGDALVVEVVSGLLHSRRVRVPFPGEAGRILDVLT
jgi:hypothetical protein